MGDMDKLVEALRQVVGALQPVTKPWLVGGSCGLLLQGVPIAASPRDLDLYTDQIYAGSLHNALSAYRTDEPVEDRSGIYRSVLSHYSIAGITVELVAGFEVYARQSVYKVEAAYLYDGHAAAVPVPSIDSAEDDGTYSKGEVKLMPLEHELLFNILRDRPDRYEAIAAVLRARSGGGTAALCDLIGRNALSGTVLDTLNRLLG